MPEISRSSGTTGTVDKAARLTQAGAVSPAMNKAALAKLNLRYDATDQTGLGGMTTLDGAMPRPVVSSPDSMILMLTEISTKMNAERMKNTEDTIKERGKEKDTKNKETIQKLQEAAASRKSSDAGSIVGKIFGWVAVALLFVVATVVAVVSGGAAAAPLFAAAMITATVMILQQSGAIDKIMEAVDASDAAKLATSIGIAIILLVINIGAAALSGGAGSAGVAEAGAEITEAAAEVGTEVTATATEVAAETGAEVTETATELVESVTETVTETVETATETVEEATEMTEAATEVAGQTVKEGVKEGVKESVKEGIKESVKSAMKKVTQNVSGKLGKMTLGMKVKGGVQALAGTTGMVSTGASTASSITGYQASMSQADVQDIKAMIAKLDAMNEEDLEHIRKTMTQLQDQISDTMLMLSDSSRTTKRIFTSA